MAKLTTENWTSIPTIQTDKFHWVSVAAGGDYILFLADEENNMLCCPVLKNVTDSEKRLINSYMNWYEDFEEKFASDCFPSPKTSADIVVITAPLYRQPAGGDAVFHYEKVFTSTWIDPRKVQKMNEFIMEHIPKEKIVSPGCYVKDI